MHSFRCKSRLEVTATWQGGRGEVKEVGEGGKTDRVAGLSLFQTTLPLETLQPDGVPTSFQAERHKLQRFTHAVRVERSDVTADVSSL